MCFRNSKIKLDQYRKRKRPIRVWKTGDINPDTGLITTGAEWDVRRYTVWKLGEEIRPHKILKPLKNSEECTAGLYFYTKDPNDCCEGQHDKQVIAMVDPKDIIAISGVGDILCCTKATVIKAPNPDQRLKRIKFLQNGIKGCKLTTAMQNKIIQEWEAGKEDRQECLKNMQDEIIELMVKGKQK